MTNNNKKVIVSRDQYNRATKLIVTLNNDQFDLIKICTIAYCAYQAHEKISVEILTKLEQIKW